ncbi:MAG: 6-bladed beta-propeller [Bacteroidota bacterium]
MQEIGITPILEIEYFSDSTFFIDVRSIDVDKYLYVLDSEVDRIFVFDLEGNHQETIGVHGRGPAELFETIQLKAFHDTLIVYSSGKGNFQRFHQGAFVDEIPIPTDLGQFIGFRFTVANHHLYFTPFNGEGSVVAMDINNPEMFSVFGTIIPSEHPRRKLFQNSRLVLSFDDQIITVGKYLTHIERYTLDGQLLERFDLKDLALYRGRLEYIENFPLAENQIIDLAVDAFVYNDKLFIVPFLNMEEKVYTNRVIQICLASQPMVAERVYNLGEGGFSTIAVKNNYLWAFRRGWSPAIVKYVLD